MITAFSGFDIFRAIFRSDPVKTHSRTRSPKEYSYDKRAKPPQPNYIL